MFDGAGEIAPCAGDAPGGASGISGALSPNDQCDEFGPEDEADPCAEEACADGIAIAYLVGLPVQLFEGLSRTAEGAAWVCEACDEVVLFLPDAFGQEDGSVHAGEWVAGGVTGGSEDGEDEREEEDNGDELSFCGLFPGGFFFLGGIADCAEGASLLAESAVDAIAWGNGDGAFGEDGEQAEEDAVGAEEAAIGSSDEHAGEEEDGAEEEHMGRRAHSEESDEGIIAADDEVASDGGKQDGEAEVEVGEEAEAMFDPWGHMDGFEQDDVLDSSEGADGGAEDSSPEEGEEQGDDEEECDGPGEGIGIWPGRQGDVADGPDGADAPFAPESEVDEGEDGEPEDAPSGAFLEDEPGGGDEGGAEHCDIDPLLSGPLDGGDDRGGHFIAAAEIGCWESLDGRGRGGPKEQEGGNDH